MTAGFSQDRRLVSSFAPQRVYTPSAESAAPDSVVTPAASSLWYAFYAWLGGCIGICSASMQMHGAPRAPRPQADPEEAAPVSTEAAITAKIRRIVQDFQEATQEATEALAREPSGPPVVQVDKIVRIAQNFNDAVREANAALGRESTGALEEQINKLIVDLGINLAPRRAAHAAGAGANAAREGSKGLRPPAPEGDAPQGRHQRKFVSNDAVLEKAIELLTDTARRATDAGRQLTMASLVTRFTFLPCPYRSQARCRYSFYESSPQLKPVSLRYSSSRQKKQNWQLPSLECTNGWP